MTNFLSRPLMTETATNFVKINKDIDETYSSNQVTNICMATLGQFLLRDEGTSSYRTSFKDWALNSSPDYDMMTSNCTMVEREGDRIFLTDLYSAEAIPTRLCMTLTQFTALIDEWHSKVVKPRPKNIIIKHEHGQFFIETSND